MRFESYVFLLFSMALVFMLLGYTNPMYYLATSQQQNINTPSLTNSTTLTTHPDPTLANAQTVQPLSLGSVLLGFVQALTNPQILTLIVVAFGAALILGVIGGGGGSTFAGSLAGFSVMYLLPLAIFATFINLFVFPMSFIFDASLPDVIKIPVVVLFNILFIMAAISFIRGGN